VAKELLENPKLIPKEERPPFDPQLSEAYLLKLMRHRSAQSLMELGQKFQQLKAQHGLFDAWMLKLSDEVQHAARAYGEALCLQALLNHPSPYASCPL
jgi:hypothetical protein